MSAKDRTKAEVEATDDVPNRMRRALELSGISVNQMSQWLECNRNSIGNWLSRRAPASPQTLRLWAQATNVPYEWLKTGNWPNGWDRTKDQVING